MESTSGTLGSLYTTVEGILDKIATDLMDTPFASGDSAFDQKINEYIMKLRDLQQMKQKFTLIVDDPLSNCFIFPIGERENDKRLTKEVYERTFEPNLGINDMNVDHYCEDEKNIDKNK